MCKNRLIILIALISVMPGIFAFSASMTVDNGDKQLVTARKWFISHLREPFDGLPFSFRYGGLPSDRILRSWTFRMESKILKDHRVRHRLSWTDPAGGVSVGCEAIEYMDFPTLEWTVRIKNGGRSDTPLITDFLALDAAFAADNGSVPVLRYISGDLVTPLSFEPHADSLSTGQVKRFAPPGGRPTHDAFPYYNLGLGDQGVIAVIGWPGQWAAAFSRIPGDSVEIRAGQETTSFVLHPGEEVRSPLVVLQFYEGDWIRSQNVWRQWMVAFNLPEYKGKPVKPMASACNGNHYPGIITNAAEELKFMKGYLDHGIKPDFWWEDAGWYRCGDQPDWTNVGTWETDARRWPGGIREVGDWCRARGIGTILWYEPERVTPGSKIAESHPEWILKTNSPGGTNTNLLNIGIPECRAWLADFMEKSLRQNRVDVYRQDFNMNPLPYWLANDRADRRGMTENLHVQGYLAYWDDLISRFHGRLMIDDCASGGGRLDIETLRRSVPLLRSDYLFDANAQQCHNYGISFWLPFTGTGFMTYDHYLIRSSMCAEFTMGVDTRIADSPFEMVRKALADWREVSDAYLGDYYPLTSYSQSTEAFMAWQYHDPLTGKGFVQSFRRESCQESLIKLRLSGLNPDAVYVVRNPDSGTSEQMTGKQLTEVGLAVSHPTPRSAVILIYRQL